MSSLRAEYGEDEYRFTTEDGLVSIKMSRFRVDSRSGIKVECEVRWHGDKPGLLKSSDLSLSAGTTIKQWANECEARVGDHDWYATLTAATVMAKDRYRAGDPPRPLGDTDPSERSRWLIRPILEYGGPTVVSAAGGSMKSFLALALLLTKTTGRGKFLGIGAHGPAAPGWYLDWEADDHAHRNRSDALCKGAGIADTQAVADSVMYRREWAPLYESVDELVRYARTQKPSMIVIDSKGAALGGAPEEAEVTLRFFGAVRKLGVPCLIVDHVTNAAAEGTGAKRPIGSVYTQNLARNVFYAEKGDEQPGELMVMWKHIKSNNGPANLKLVWRLEIDMTDSDDFDRVKITPESSVTWSRSVDTEDSLRGKLRLTLTHATAKGQFLTIRELCDLTGHKEGSVRARLNEGRLDNEFANVARPGEPGRWLMASGITKTEELAAPWPE